MSMEVRNIEIFLKIRQTANLRVHEAVCAGLLPMRVVAQKAL